MSALKLHNAMWPGLVGKGDEEGQEPPISLERMLDLTAAAEGVPVEHPTHCPTASPFFSC